MGEFTPELYDRCRRTLLNCAEFDDHASLQAIFVTSELQPFQPRLPQTNNKQDRVAQVLAFLMDKQLQDGRFILPLFLQALTNRYNSADAQHHQLKELAELTQFALTIETQSLAIPFDSQSVEISDNNRRVLEASSQSSLVSPLYNWNIEFLLLLVVFVFIVVHFFVMPYQEWNNIVIVFSIFILGLLAIILLSRFVWLIDSYSRIDLNHADISEFIYRGKIAESQAWKVIKFREKYGTFKSIQQAQSVPGLSDKTRARLGRKGKTQGYVEFNHSKYIKLAITMLFD